MSSCKLLERCTSQKPFTLLHRTLFGRKAQSSGSTPQSDQPVDPAAEERAELVAKLRNKSGLNRKHYIRSNGQGIPSSSLELAVTSLRGVRAWYGQDGRASGVPEKYLWPSKQELALMKEYEQVAYPLSLPEMIQKAEREKEEALEFTINRQSEVHKNMESLKKWMKDVTSKVENAERTKKIAKEKRQRLVEEVRLMFGVRIDPKSDKFQEALEKKEAEEKKAIRALRKQEKQQKMLVRLKKLAEQETPKEGQAEAAAEATDPKPASS